MHFTDLLKLISDFMLKVLEGANCLLFRGLSIKHSLLDMKPQVDECFLKNFESISTQSTFCRLLAQDLKETLSSDRLMVSLWLLLI